MKTFLIATDFSAASRNASQYGMALAKAFNGKVILFHAWQHIPVTVTEPLIINAPDIAAIATRRLEEEAELLNTEKSSLVEILAKEGPGSHMILEAAKEVNADIIIAGMKGTGKAARRFFGSTVTSLARKTSIPLVVIPEDAHYRNPQTIALANDISPLAGMHLLEALSSLAERFQSKLYIVRVITKRSDEIVEILNRPSNLNKMVGKLEPLYEFPLDKNITRALDDFIAAHRIDLLVMIPHKEPLPERWFLRSNTREMIFRTKIPLLILPERKDDAAPDIAVVHAETRPADLKNDIQSAIGRIATLDPKKIIIEVEGDSVILSGTVRSLADGEFVEHAAWSAPGVSNVVNRLMLEETEE